MLNDIKRDFPILSQKFNGHRLVYLDNAATTQKPKQVIDAICEFYSKHNANVSRSSHFLADNATDMYESARREVASFINADEREIVFTKNATESLNTVALSWGVANLGSNDVILSLSSEHNSSLLPWKSAALKTGASIEYIHVNEFGTLQNDWKTKFTSKVKVVLLSHVSNVLGSIIPVDEIAKKAKEVGAIVIVDGSQAVSHLDVDVKSLKCDFYAFSGHKMMAPMGIGVLWGKKELLDSMTPVSFGGGIVTQAEITTDSLLPTPQKFEAGTPNVSGAVGLSEAIKYIHSIGIENIRAHSQELTNYTIERLEEIPDLSILGPRDIEDRVGIVSFNIKGIHSHDISSILSTKGVALRSGMHCAMNLFDDLELPSSTRVSLYIYNDIEDIDTLVNGLNSAIKTLKK